MTKISTNHVECTIDGQDVAVTFQSPYRWRIFKDGQDVTSKFGHAKRGDSLPRNTSAWRAFHDAVDSTMKREFVA